MCVRVINGGLMSKRHRISRGSSKRMFRATASRVHPKNISSGSSYVMRGGIRL